MDGATFQSTTGYDTALYLPVYVTVWQLDLFIDGSPQLWLKGDKHITSESREVCPHSVLHQLHIWLPAELFRFSICEIIIRLKGRCQCWSKVKQCLAANCITELGPTVFPRNTGVACHANKYRGDPCGSGGTDGRHRRADKGLRGGECLGVGALPLLVAQLFVQFLVISSHPAWIALHSGRGRKGRRGERGEREEGGEGEGGRRERERREGRGEGGRRERGGREGEKEGGEREEGGEGDEGGEEEGRRRERGRRGVGEGEGGTMNGTGWSYLR